MTPKKRQSHRATLQSMLNKQVKITYLRKKADKKEDNSVDIIHSYHGKVLVIRKSSFLLQLNDLYRQDGKVTYKTVSIGYRNIIGEPIQIQHD